MDLLAAGQYNLLVLCPVVAVVAGLVLVFLFGFKRPDELKFKKSTISGSDSKKSLKKKDTKKPTVNGVGEKSSSNESAKKERSVESTVKKSPTKEVKPKKAAVRQDTVKKEVKAAAKSTPKATKKEKVKEEKVVEKKPEDFDDGNWFTVPTKSEKKKSKTDDVTNSPKPSKIEPTIVEQKKNVKNAKQLKDQVNKSKKEAEDAAATKELKLLEKEIVEPVIAAPEVVAKPKPTVIDEEDKQTAEIIEKIQEAIVDVVIEPVTVQKEIVSKSISKKIVADREEKVDEIKPVESNVAFDELADAHWTEAKPTKKNKKKVRKD